MPLEEEWDGMRSEFARNMSQARILPRVSKRSRARRGSLRQMWDREGVILDSGMPGIYSWRMMKGRLRVALT